MTVVLTGRDRSNARLLQWLIFAMEYAQRLNNDVLEIQLGLQQWELEELSALHMKELRMNRRRRWSETEQVNEIPPEKLFCHEA